MLLEYLARCAAFAIAGMLAFSTSRAAALEWVTFQVDSRDHVVAGRILVEAQDGGLLLEAPDGHIWALQPDQIVSRRSDEVEFEYWDRQRLGESLLRELPAGFEIHETAHYLICYNTSRAFAQWSGALFERLYSASMNFWKQKGLDLTEPPVLVALVFRDKASFVEYGRQELGDAASSVIGYYSLATNRMTTYDLTGLEQSQNGNARGSIRQINRRILAQPEAERTVATVIHEATHQLAFNTGMQVRFADNPLWLSEGLAIYFEAPDLNSSRGWRKIGALHPLRMRTLKKSLGRRSQNALLDLLTSDAQFRDTRRAEDAYAEAWAFCYFLIRQYPKEFLQYLRLLGDKPYLTEDTPEARLRDFENAFGRSWQDLDTEFLRSIPTWR